MYPARAMRARTGHKTNHSLACGRQRSGENVRMMLVKDFIVP